MNKSFTHWDKIFDTKKFDTSVDLHFISADEIKAITSAEPRILAKMDSSNDVPPIFKKYGYFLLPVKNGQYAIVRGNGFHELEKREASTEYTSRIRFALTTAGRGMSEMQYLDYGFNSGALEHILASDQPLYQSIRGREYTKPFSFNVGTSHLDTGSVQIEVDAGFEGEDKIVLMEAKVKTPEDFIIRQLFYPYNHFRAIAPQKEIIPVFFTYEPKEKSYNYWIYEFVDAGNYNSIQLKERRSLTILAQDEVQLIDVRPQGVVKYKNLVPQANDLDKVIELAFKVSEGMTNYREVATYFGFDERQSSYYREAAEALGLVVSDGGTYELTDVGKQLISLPAEKRNIFMAQLLSDFDLIKYGLERIRSGKPLTREDIIKLIESNSSLTGTTVTRRASSLASWYKWISKATGLFDWDGNAFVSK
jgi:hypothetical protein